MLPISGGVFTFTSTLGCVHFHLASLGIPPQARMRGRGRTNLKCSRRASRRYAVQPNAVARRSIQRQETQCYRYLELCSLSSGLPFVFTFVCPLPWRPVEAAAPAYNICACEAYTSSQSHRGGLAAHLEATSDAPKQQAQSCRYPGLCSLSPGPPICVHFHLPTPPRAPVEAGAAYNLRAREAHPGSTPRASGPHGPASGATRQRKRQAVFSFLQSHGERTGRFGRRFCDFRRQNSSAARRTSKDLLKPDRMGFNSDRKILQGTIITLWNF